MGAFFAEYGALLGSSALLTVLFWLPEALAPAERGQPLALRLRNLAWLPFILAWVLALQTLVTPAAGAILRAAGGGVLPRLIGAPESLAAKTAFTLFFALAWDVWQYAVHRLQHASPLLWTTHALHHEETALNATSQARHHPTNYLLFAVLYLPLLLLFGGLAPHPVGAFLMFRLWGFVNHANVRVSFGWATPLLAGPQWHRLHHSTLPEHRDRNFAAFFPFLDVVFGTYAAPKEGEWPRTGTEDQRPIGAAVLRPRRV